MPKVIKPGATAPQGPPPAGLVATCDACGATLETTSDEPNARPIILEDGPTKKPGWYIACPACYYIKVFFEQPRRH